MLRILDEFQKEVLREIGKSELVRFFVWSGGTALSFYYLRHRSSADLDFLSRDLLPDEYLLGQIKKIAENLKIKEIEEQKRFNRHEFWLRKNGKTLRLEFVFYPFPHIKAPKMVTDFGIKIDSLEDILVNKAHALYERAEPKDVFDFYYILQKKKIKFLKIFKLVEKKFGVKIDPVLFTSKILEGLEKLRKIKPRILKKRDFKPNLIKTFFQKEATKYLRKKIKQ